MRRYLFVAALVTLVAFVFPGVGISAPQKESGQTPSSSTKKAASTDFMERIKNQQQRIDHGRESGRLTQEEAGIVQDNLKGIRETYQKLKADGKLTNQEQEKLDGLLDKNNQMIKDKKSNPVKRIEKD